MMDRYHTYVFDDCTEHGTWDLKNIRAPLERAMSFIKRRSILDVGTRDGWYAALFAKMGASATCLDIEDRSARRDAFSRLGVDVPFIHQNVYSLANESGRRYDHVFSSDMLIHCEHPILALRAMAHQARLSVILGFGANNVNIVQRPDDKNSPYYGFNYIWRLTIENWVNLCEIAGLRNPREICRGKALSKRWGDAEMVFVKFQAPDEEDTKMLDLGYIFPQEVTERN